MSPSDVEAMIRNLAARLELVEAKLDHPALAEMLKPKLLKAAEAMTEVERWLADTFCREGSDLIIGPVRGRHAFDREQVDVLLKGLTEIRDVLPTLEQRLAGLSTCETCEGSGIVHGIDAANEYDCPVCEGNCFSPRKEEDF